MRHRPPRLSHGLCSIMDRHFPRGPYLLVDPSHRISPVAAVFSRPTAYSCFVMHCFVHKRVDRISAVGHRTKCCPSFARPLSSYNHAILQLWPFMFATIANERAMLVARSVLSSRKMHLSFVLILIVRPFALQLSAYWFST